MGGFWEGVCALAVVIMLSFLSFGYGVNSTHRFKAEDCDNYGKVQLNGTRYECKPLPEIKGRP